MIAPRVVEHISFLHVQNNSLYTWICLRRFFALYHGIQNHQTTIWKNVFLLVPSILSKSEFSFLLVKPIYKAMYRGHNSIYNWFRGPLCRIVQCLFLVFWGATAGTRQRKHWEQHVNPMGCEEANPPHKKTSFNIKKNTQKKISYLLSQRWCFCYLSICFFCQKVKQWFVFLATCHQLDNCATNLDRIHRIFC